MSIKKQGEDQPQGLGFHNPVLDYMREAVDSARNEAPEFPTLVKVIDHFEAWSIGSVEALRFLLLYRKGGNSIKPVQWQIAANWYIFGLRNPIKDV